MELNQFITVFADQFDDTDTSNFTKDTIFKDLEEWSSLTTLSIIGIVDEEFDVRITGDEIKKANSIEDLFELIKSKKK